MQSEAQLRSGRRTPVDGGAGIRIRGINYDTGFGGDGHPSRRTFDAATVQREMHVIAGDLHCTAVRVSGSDLDKLTVAGEAALVAGLQLWFAPFPTDLAPAELIAHLTDAARRAAELHRHYAGRVVFVMGCELSLFEAGLLPGADVAARLAAMTSGWNDAFTAAFTALPSTLNTVLADAVASVRAVFPGRVTYASGTWERVDWSLFDMVGVDLYRDSQSDAAYRQQLRAYRSAGKPIAITEFGCCTYRGAAARGGLGFAIIDWHRIPPALDDHYERSEREQADCLRTSLAIFDEEGVDAAFWFTFAAYELPHRADPAVDLDMASFGLVKMRDAVGATDGEGAGGEGTNGAGFDWEPKAAFRAMASAYSRRAVPIEKELERTRRTPWNGS